VARGNKKKMYQRIATEHVAFARIWRRHAQHYANELTNAHLAVMEYEQAMTALLDEAEAERDWYREAWELLLP